MKKLLAPLALLLCVSITGAADEKKPDPKGAAFDASKMIGEYTYVSGVKAGEKIDKERLMGKVKIAKDTMTLPSGQAKDFLMAYKVDPKASPATIDLEIKESPGGESGKAKGIVAIDGENVKICYHPTGGDRPKKFESSKENGAFYFVLKKAK